VASGKRLAAHESSVGQPNFNSQTNLATTHGESKIMNWKNTKNRYGIITKSFHWTVAFLIFLQFALGMMMGSLPDDGDGKILGFGRPEIFEMHQSYGALLLLVVIGRIAWRWFSELPDWAESLTKGDKTFAHYAERTLYWLMFLTPLFGLLCVMAKADHVYFFGLHIPSFLPQNESLVMAFGLGHAITRMALLLVVLLHIGYVFRHQFFKKDGLLKRMLPFN